MTVERVAVQQSPGFDQPLGDERAAAGVVQVGGHEAAAGLRDPRGAACAR